KHFERRNVLDLLHDLVHRTVKDALGNGLLAVPHERVDELADQLAVVARVRLEHVFRCGELLVCHLTEFLLCGSVSRRMFSPSTRRKYSGRINWLNYLPFLAPYLERLRLRPSTPSASSVPRTMW